jgi:hypothetical protein
MAIDPYSVWANMKLKTWPERYWMVDLFDGAAEAAARAVVYSASRYCCVIRDQAGLSVIADEETLTSMEAEVTPRDRLGPFRVVSTDGELPFDVIGFLQPVLKELNGQGIKAGPQCGVVFDHLFIYEKDIERAEEILEGFIESARSRYSMGG